MKDNYVEKHFSITDPTNVNTVIYQINETAPEHLKDSPKFTIERLESTSQKIGENTRKTFYIPEGEKEDKQLVILSFGQERVVVNMGVFEENKVKISKHPVPMKFKTLYSDKEAEYKDFLYTPNLKRPISIIDPDTTDEIKPILYFDETTNEIKGKCKLKPFKNYFAFEIRDDID